MPKTYNFGTHWTTTDQDLTGYIEVFEVTEEQAEIIEQGANIESDGEQVIIEILPIH